MLIGLSIVYFAGLDYKLLDLQLVKIMLYRSCSPGHTTVERFCKNFLCISSYVLGRHAMKCLHCQNVQYIYLQTVFVVKGDVVIRHVSSSR